MTLEEIEKELLSMREMMNKFEVIETEDFAKIMLENVDKKIPLVKGFRNQTVIKPMIELQARVEQLAVDFDKSQIALFECLKMMDDRLANIERIEAVLKENAKKTEVKEEEVNPSPPKEFELDMSEAP